MRCRGCRLPPRGDSHANALTEPSTIRLATGIYTLRAADNETDGPNGLPSVTKTLSIQGSGAEATIIERAADAPNFRLVHVAPTGTLTLEGLTLRGGGTGNSFVADFAGGAIVNNGGRVTLNHSRLAGNHATGGFGYGGGLFNNGGVVILSSSTLADNLAAGVGGFGGGLATDGGTVTITNSAVVDNRASGMGANGGGFAEVSTGPLPPVGPRPASVEIVNSTIARNTADGHHVSGGGIATRQGRWTITNSTIAGNAVSGIDSGGAGILASGPVSLQNTIVAQNVGADCSGSVTSLGYNLIGDPTGCTIALQPHDRTGSPGLAIYTDDGMPGHAHWPLLPTSQAIDGGDASICPPTDQLGRPRLGRCDIGAAEFFPAADPRGDFVRGFYRYALGREPGPTEVTGWLSFLQADATPASARVMTRAFFDGQEYRARPFTPESHVTALYRAILGRDPEPPGGWTGLLQDRRNAVPHLVIDSPEFQALVPSCHDESAVRALVIRLYEKLLGRSPGMTDPIGTVVSNIVTYCGIQDVVQLFLNSEEYTRVSRTLAEHVTNLYRALLAREPGPDEVAGWIDSLAPPFIEDQFIDSPEFTARWQQLVP